MRKFVVALVLLVTFTGCRAADSREPVPLTNVHAHNDYNHPRPLFDALDCGFCSIEADVALVNGQIIVTHDPKRADAARTLESLYLDPLEKRIATHGGKVYRDGPTVILLIDFKSDWHQLYPALRELLMKHRDVLTMWDRDGKHERAITVVLTGGHPLPDAFANETTRIVAIDGNLRDIDSTIDPQLMPQISVDWRSAIDWDGYGAMPADDRQSLHDLVERAHAHHRTLRLWSAPDQPRAWQELLDAGVDYVNTDDLRGLQQFLLALRATSQPYIRKTPANSPPDPGSK